MITITVKISQDSNNTTTIRVKEALCWSSGRPYTLEDYAIFAMVEKERNEPKQFLFNIHK